jgi:hypothetical protein
MNVDLRKTATDAAYIAVGAGVLGFQQAQVRRREARAGLERRANDVKAAAGTLQATVTGVGSDLAGRAVELKDKAAELATVDPRTLVEPVVEELRNRVEPVIEQLKAVRLPEQVQALPDQLSKAAATGRDRIRELRGNPPAAGATA